MWKKNVMVKLTLTLLCLLLLPLSIAAQKSVSELPPAHASALQEFLSKHSELQFLSEREMDKETLKDMRKNFGARLTPYYRTGDFNRDGIQDFAMILAKEGPPSEDLGPDIAETHRYAHDITVVIFNGQKKGGFKASFEKNTTGPLVCFLYSTYEKKKRLYFAVYETDEHFIMSPAGRGYIVEYEPDKD
ncbi:MAG: hypothetical protein M3R69_09130 [Acidobacteriota bacterium]|nr:hypothetical protein [Acidobacteriota bacterium]